MSLHSGVYQGVDELVGTCQFWMVVVDLLMDRLNRTPPALFIHAVQKRPVSSGHGSLLLKDQYHPVTQETLRLLMHREKVNVDRRSQVQRWIGH